jgi:hypothetical protein
MERIPRGGAVNARHWSRLAATAFLVACLLIAGVARPARALTPAGEYEVKAAFLVNFAGFVRWPAAAFAAAASPFVVCVAGDDPFGMAFEPFKRPGRRANTARHIDSTAACRELPHPSSPGRSPCVLRIRWLWQGPVLTVSDPNFCRRRMIRSSRTKRSVSNQADGCGVVAED